MCPGQRGRRCTKIQGTSGFSQSKAHPGAQCCRNCPAQGREMPEEPPEAGLCPLSHFQQESSHGSSPVPADNISYCSIEEDFCSFIFKGTQNFLHKTVGLKDVISLANPSAQAGEGQIYGCCINLFIILHLLGSDRNFSRRKSSFRNSTSNQEGNTPR